jgi:2,3-bisphosphoglycerate-dependent phosphoglycerate mutase/probable phosphoglycerate mutase
MKLYIIRHGQSVNNALSDQRDRVKDPALTELGERQAKMVAKHLATGFDPEYFLGVSAEATTAQNTHHYNIKRLYCSAMHRALLTAQPIGQALGLAPEVWLDIHEVGGIFIDHNDGHGPVGYPGKGRSEMLAEFPGYMLPDEITEEGWWPPDRGKEDYPGCQGRALKVANRLRKWADDGEDGEIAMVSHGGFVDSLLKALTNQLPGRHVFYHHYNTGITRVDFSSKGRVDVRHLNRFDHLPPELVS